MNPDSTGSADTRGDDPDLGRPIDSLKEQELEPSSDFVGQVRRSIHRRTAASQLASYSWNLPKIALLEMARLLSHLLESFGTNKEPKI